MKVNRMLPFVNSSSECIELLDDLEKAISVLYMLTDDHYISYIWNASTKLEEKLDRFGFDEDYFTETANKLEILFALLASEGYKNSVLISKMREEEPEEDE